MSNTKPSRSWLTPYRTALQAISTRTGTALPSLITSFAILHEATAVVPLFGLFFGARYLGFGEKVVQFVKNQENGDSAQAESGFGTEPGWLREKPIKWMHEGEDFAGRVGKRYGWWGFEKGKEPVEGRRGYIEEHLAGDIANAVVAYGATKALMPLRVAFSLYFAPAFSRRIIDPFASTILRPFRRK